MTIRIGRPCSVFGPAEEKARKMKMPLFAVIVFGASFSARGSPGPTKTSDRDLIGSYLDQGSGALTDWSVCEDKRPLQAKELKDHQGLGESVKVLCQMSEEATTIFHYSGGGADDDWF